jgi:hypothetical protein
VILESLAAISTQSYLPNILNLTNLQGVSCGTALVSPPKQFAKYTIITPTKCTLLLLKAPDITIRTLCLIFCPCMFQPAWVIVRGLNASAWLKLLLITIY